MLRCVLHVRAARAARSDRRLTFLLHSSKLYYKPLGSCGKSLLHVWYFLLHNGSVLCRGVPVNVFSVSRKRWGEKSWLTAALLKWEIPVNKVQS